MDKTYTLTLRESAVGTSSIIMPITSLADEWRRSIRWDRGAYKGSFKVFGEADELINYFINWLGKDILEETAGIKSWNGLIWRIEYQGGAIPRVLEYDKIYNRVQATYHNSGRETTWAENVYSTALYGDREDVIDISSRGLADAEAARDAYLKHNAWPTEFPVGNTRSFGEPPHLIVHAAGYWATLNNKYQPMLDDEGETISDFLDDVVSASNFIDPYSIETDTRLVDYIEGMRSGDLIEKVLKEFISADTIQRAWINNDRKFSYKTWDLTPEYYIVNGILRLASNSSVDVSPRLIQPGVAHDTDWILQGPARDSLFQDRADFLIEEVDVDENDVIQYRVSTSPMSDYLLAFNSNTDEPFYNKWAGLFVEGKVTDQERYKRWLDSASYRKGHG